MGEGRYRHRNVGEGIAADIAVLRVETRNTAHLATVEAVRHRRIIGVLDIAALCRQPGITAIVEAIFEHPLQPPAGIVERVLAHAGARLDIAADIEGEPFAQRLRIIEFAALHPVIIGADSRCAFGFVEVRALRNEVDRRAGAIDRQHARRTALDRFEAIDGQVLVEEEVGPAAAVQDRHAVLLQLHEALAAALKAADRIVVRHLARGRFDEDAGHQFEHVGGRARRATIDVGAVGERDVGRCGDERTVARRGAGDDDHVLLVIGRGRVGSRRRGGIGRLGLCPCDGRQQRGAGQQRGTRHIAVETRHHPLPPSKFVGPVISGTGYI